MFDSRKKFIPESGFNVVGIDTFELPGEELYLIKHYDNEKDAKEYAKKDKNYIIIEAKKITDEGDVDGVETEDKALDTDSPIAPKQNEEMSTAINKYLKKKKKEVIDLIKNSYQNNTLTEIKSMWPELINKIKELFNIDDLRSVVESFVEKHFIKGLDKAESKLDMNFFPNPEKLKFIEEYNFDLIKNMTDDLSQKIKATLQRGYMNDVGFDVLANDIKDAFDVSKTRAKAIVRTEQTRIDNIGQLDGAMQSPLNLKKELRIVDDSRTTPLCKRMYNKYKNNPIPLDEKFKDSKTGDEWEAPPFHVNCRTGIKTVRVKKNE